MNTVLKHLLIALGFLVAMLVACIAYALFLGLGIHRHGDPIAVAMSATMIVFGPALVASAMRDTQRTLTFSGILVAWAFGLLLCTPLYFPGERVDALRSGLSLALDDTDYAYLSTQIAGYLPHEPKLSEPQPQLATALVVPKPPPEHRLEDDSNTITLPFEGEGSRLSVPVVFEHNGDSLELDMMLDTGATYTTLSRRVAGQLGIEIARNAPVLELHTANGIRSAQVVLVDRVWLGDLSLDGVAITICDDCASSDTAGLLGLNVSGAYNVRIDSDRQEVAFSLRHDLNRKLDVKPFAELDASFIRYPGNRIEVKVQLDNFSPRFIDEARALILCRDERWVMAIQNINPYKKEEIRRRLPKHEPCDSYEVSLEQALW